MDDLSPFGGPHQVVQEAPPCPEVGVSPCVLQLRIRPGTEVCRQVTMHPSGVLNHARVVELVSMYARVLECPYAKGHGALVQGRAGDPQVRPHHHHQRCPQTIRKSRPGLLQPLRKLLERSSRVLEELSLALLNQPVLDLLRTAHVSGEHQQLHLPKPIQAGRQQRARHLHELLAAIRFCLNQNVLDELADSARKFANYCCRLAAGVSARADVDAEELHVVERIGLLSHDSHVHLFSCDVPLVCIRSTLGKHEAVSDKLLASKSADWEKIDRLERQQVRHKGLQSSLHVAQQRITRFCICPMGEDDANTLWQEHGQPVEAEATDIVCLVDDDEDLVLWREAIDVDAQGLEVQLQRVVQLRNWAQGGGILRGNDVGLGILHRIWEDAVLQGLCELVHDEGEHQARASHRPRAPNHARDYVRVCPARTPSSRDVDCLGELEKPRVGVGHDSVALVEHPLQVARHVALA
mmetsp:Transcript_876/g.2177  ORF Transcript_876/g.2177 Transcript_876/m.2177 type:complete len:466 (-) Transcript_876:2490-3887(-)